MIDGFGKEKYIANLGHESFQTFLLNTPKPLNAVKELQVMSELKNNLVKGIVDSERVLQFAL